MPNEYPMNDPRSVWQNQPTEPLKMSADEMRRRAQRFHANARLMALVSITIGLALCVFFGITFAMVHEVRPRIGWGLLSLWGIYGAYHAYRWIWPRNLPPDAPVSTCLEFYRRELERRRDYERHLWWRSGMPFCLLGIVIAVAGTGARNASPYKVPTTTMLLNAVPFFVLLAIWAAGMFLLKKRLRPNRFGPQNIQQEIDELRAYERENR
jgi:hypothetical protein